MLGVEYKRVPISSTFAKEMRNALERAKTGRLTTSEIKARQRVKEASKKYNVVWL